MEDFADQPPTPLPRALYNVFLSFRGIDTRATFVCHLYSSLVNAGFRVFKDDEEVPLGGEINSILRAIENSEISIIVLSRNYAASRWCMVELEQIMKCRSCMGQAAIPVFYGVDPYEVRHQKGDFGEAFEDFINRKSVIEDNFERWKEALYQVGGISGFVVKNSRNESKDIENIVEQVCSKLNTTHLFVAEHPVGVKSRVQNMIQLLNNHPSNEVVLVGIWGMGGSGKTTLAKAIYNEIGRNFQGTSFLSNIRQVWYHDHNGPLSLQERLLCDIYKGTKMKIHSIELGKMKMKESLVHKTILVVLDDVNKLEQLQALCGSREWLGPGSRIFITTRDQHLLKSSEVDFVYNMEKMDENESFELFSWHAFKRSNPRGNFVRLSKEVVAYCGGLPLALQVLGSCLFDREATQWESLLKLLKRIPNDQIQKKLKISFDDLDDVKKQIFLDISCFFIGMNRNVATHILNECGFYADFGISVLIEKSLVTVDNKNKLGMHDLLRDMGREIIREKSPIEVEKRSRLWSYNDALDVLSTSKGTERVEGLSLKLQRNHSVCLRTKAFEKMKRLRLLQLGHVQLKGDYEYLSKNINWLCWYGFPCESTPKSFYQGNLVALELKHSNLRQVWKHPMVLEKLKILNLSHSHYLEKTPDFSKLPNLERLILKDCPKLLVIHHTIGLLKNILEINLKDCKSLDNLPKSIYKLKSLKDLNLSQCSKIEELEEDMMQMESLTKLIANNTAIKRVPFSVVRSKSIEYISLCGYEGLSHEVFPSIILSWMSPNKKINNLLQGLSSSSSSSLVSIDEPNPSVLSHILDELPRLQSLCMTCGSDSQLTQGVERILSTLYAANSTELETISSQSSSSSSNMAIMETEGDALLSVCCSSQVHKLASKNSLGCFLLQVGRSDQVTNTLTQSIISQVQKFTTTNSGYGDCSDLPGDNYPKWVTFNGKGPSVLFQVPQVSNCTLRRMILCIIYSSCSGYHDTTKVINGSNNNIINNVLIINHSKKTIKLYKRETLASSDDDGDCERILSSFQPCEKVEIYVVSGFGLILKKTSVYLIYGESSSSSEGKLLLEFSHEVDHDEFASISNIGDENECVNPARTTMSKGKSSIGKRFLKLFSLK